MILPLGKEKISEKLGISVATVNNWIKTQVIPAPNRNNSYSKAAFDSIIEMIKDGQSRLNSRANRTLQKKKNFVI